jgi:hypothetical protein
MKISARILLLLLLLLLPLLLPLPPPPPPKAASNRTAPAHAKAIATPTIPVPDESQVMSHKTPSTQKDYRRTCAQFDHGNGAAAAPTSAVKQVTHSLGRRCPANRQAPAAIHCLKAAAANKNLLCFKMWAGLGGCKKASYTC